MENRFGGGGWILVPLRLMVGFGFAAHGYAKLARGPEHFAAILTSLGVPQPHVMAWVTSLLELLGGISVMAGAFVAPLSLPLACVMLSALITVHLQYGFSSIRLVAVTAAGAQFGPIGYELNLLYIVGLLTLALGGAGRVSVDHWLSRRRQRISATSGSGPGAYQAPVEESPRPGENPGHESSDASGPGRPGNRGSQWGAR